MNKTLEIVWGDESTIKIGEATKTSSFLYEPCRKALAGVAEIVQTSNEYIKKNSHHREECGFDGTSHLYNYPNNVIVFTGERGSGKSSTMMTFVEGLRRPRDSYGNAEDHSLLSQAFINDMLDHDFPGNKKYKNNVRENLEGCTFLPLIPIDPTAMEKNGQILAILLARMYHMAQESWEGAAGRERSIDKRNQLLKQFDECYQHVCVMKDMIPGENRIQGLEGLSRMGDSGSLKDELTELVRLFLNFCCGDNSNKFLVVQLDDTDMNISRAYEILEDIRKYLLIPRVIIIMAADIHHLGVVVQNSLRKFYDENAYDVDNMTHWIAQQYIVKLIPLKRQIELHNLGQYLREHSEMVSLTCEAGQEKIENEGNIRQQICSLIYKKTGMIFLRDMVVPYNIRRLAHLLGMLLPMPDVLEKGKAKFFPEGNRTVDRNTHVELLKKRLQNMQRFRDYFVYTWAGHELSEKGAAQLQYLDQADVEKKLETCLEIIGEKNECTDLRYACVMAALRTWGKKSRENYKLEYGIHVCLAFYVQSIALDTLIAFYEKGSGKGQKKGCVFDRLYPLLGSRVFEHRTLEYEAPEDDTEPRNIYSHWTCKLLDEKAQPSSLAQAYLTLLYSMFLDFRKRDTRADMAGAIVNCLYLSGDKARSDACVSMLGSNSRVRRFDEADWSAAQECALMILANWDVQRFIQDNILAVDKAGGKSARSLSDPLEKLGETNSYFTTIFGITAGSTAVSGSAGGGDLLKWKKEYSDDTELDFEGFDVVAENLNNFKAAWGKLTEIPDSSADQQPGQSTTAGSVTDAISGFFTPQQTN